MAGRRSTRNVRGEPDIAPCPAPLARPVPHLPSTRVILRNRLSETGLIILLLASSRPPARPRLPSLPSKFEPTIEDDKGIHVLKFWKELQNSNGKLPYDVDACYGWIGRERPKRGQFIGIAFTPNCYIVKDDLLTFLPSFVQATKEYERYSEDSAKDRNRCKFNHLFISRLHRLDEGGLFSYHYTRVRLMGNKIQVTFFALKDVLEKGTFYQTSSPNYEHPSVKFFNAEQFPPTFSAFVVYTLDYEIYVWFKTKEGLRLFNYRLTWDPTNPDNGYHVDVHTRFAIPNKYLPEERVTYIVTSDKEVHYFFVKGRKKHKHQIFYLKHTDLIKADFTQMQIFDMDMPVDVYPRSIIGRVIPYYSLSVHHKKTMRFNTRCDFGVHVEFYANQMHEDGKVKVILPNITDPPLANNIFATHFRSAYPFVQNGRKSTKPNYFGIIVPIVLAVVAALISRWIVLGYDVFPTSWSRSIRLMILTRRHFFFKARAHKKGAPFARLFYILYRIEVWIRKGMESVYNAVIWAVQMESYEEEETRQLMHNGHSQDQHSQRDSSTPNE